MHLGRYTLPEVIAELAILGSETKVMLRQGLVEGGTEKRAACQMVGWAASNPDNGNCVREYYHERDYQNDEKGLSLSHWNSSLLSFRLRAACLIKAFRLERGKQRAY